MERGRGIDEKENGRRLKWKEMRNFRNFNRISRK